MYHIKKKTKVVKQGECIAKKKKEDINHRKTIVSIINIYRKRYSKKESKCQLYAIFDE